MILVTVIAIFFCGPLWNFFLLTERRVYVAVVLCLAQGYKKIRPQNSSTGFSLGSGPNLNLLPRFSQLLDQPVEGWYHKL